MSLLLILATLLLITGIAWLVTLGYKRGGIVWAVLILFFSLIAGLAFCIVKKEGWAAWTMILIGWLIAVSVSQNWI